MKQLIPFLSNDILSLPQEDHIWLAIKAIANAGYKESGEPKLSICSAANLYQVPCSMLGDCLKGLRTHTEAHVNQQNLTPAQEEVFVKWVKVLGHHGVPLTQPTLTLYASEILGQQVGES